MQQGAVQKILMQRCCHKHVPTVHDAEIACNLACPACWPTSSFNLGRSIGLNGKQVGESGGTKIARLHGNFAHIIVLNSRHTVLRICSPSCVCMCACMYVCMHVSAREHINKYKYKYTYKYTYIHILYIYIYIYTHIIPVYIYSVARCQDSNQDTILHDRELSML